MKLTAAQKVRLGLFVVVSVSILAGALAVFTGLRFLQQRDTYVARFREDISGLQSSSTVTYRGLRVGRVRSMRVAPDDPRVIEVTLAVRPETVLYEGTRAQLSTTGLTGLRTINLVPGDPEGSVLSPGSELKTGASLVGTVTDQARVIAQKLGQVAENLSAWTNADNRRRVERLLESLDEFAGSLNVFLGEVQTPLRGALAGVAELSHEGSAVLRAARRPLEAVDERSLAETLSAARGAMQALESRLSDRETGQTLRELMGALQRINVVLKDFELVVRSGREDFSTTMSYLRQAAEDIREFSRMLAQDPSVILRGREVNQ